jgi:aryl-alcohol dehydrogenase-like predicted oxidoreductase
MVGLMMRYRTFGRSGLRVSDLFLGTMTASDPRASAELFTAYAEAGGNVIDTANKYTEGASERIVGDLLAADRDRFVLATKYTISTDPTDPNAAGNHRKSLRRSLEQSLTRLRTDHIDLLWVHIWDPDTPIEETMRALDEVVRAGKVLYVGISDTPAWVVARANTLAEWRDWSPFVGLQVPYNLLERDVERELLPAAAALGMSVAAWSPLAQGILTGRFTRSAAGNPATTRRGAVSEHQLAVARAVDAVADELGVTSSQVAIAWTRSRMPGVHPIVGASSVAQLTDNLGAAALTLPADAVRRLDEASPVALGFPADFMEATREFVFGPVDERVVRQRIGSGA